MDPDDGLEKEVLCRDEARKRAEEHSNSGQRDPFPKVPPSLLSAEHIEKYVMATGAIAPFYTGGGRNSRLKNASYEGRIGDQAYVYNSQGMLENLDIRGELTVNANSIVFVECDLDFRLPDYLALRFNLQIRHVHRGLLLGTGPLVDPGYRGKLCIPLHNLTDEDYSIPLDDGLIWIEFTKTTAGWKCTDGSAGRAADDSNIGDVEPPGRPPLDEGKEYWNTREFVERAAAPRKPMGVNVPIRSSFSKVIDRVTDAESRAQQAEQNATGAKNEASRLRENITLGGIITAIVLVVGIAGFIATVYSSLAPRIDRMHARVSGIERLSWDEDSGDVSVTVEQLVREVETLRSKIQELERTTADEEKKAR